MTRSLRASAIALAAALVFAACSTGQPVEAGSSQNLAPEQLADVGDRALPGLPALIEDECKPGQIEEVAEFLGWAPIHQVVNASGQVISGEIVEISPPRISSLDVQVEGGRLDQTYFRIVTVVADAHSFGMTEEGATPGEELQVMMIGAGADTDPETLCYGADESQDPRTLPLAVGDEVIALVSMVAEYPMVNPPKDILFLDYGPFGIWLIENGTAKSPIEGYGLEAGALLDQIRTEYERGL